MCSWCHLFFASMSTSREAPIYNLANGGQREKRALEVGTPHSLSHYPSTEPEGTRSRLQLLTEVQLREAAEEYDNFKKQKRKEKKQQQQQSITSLHNRRQKGQRMGKKGKREGDWGERTFLPPLPFLRLSRSGQGSRASINTGNQASLMVSSLKFSFFQRICENKESTF